MMHEDGTSERQGTIHCPWIMTGEACDVMADTRNALVGHIYEEHINPRDTLLRCPVESCSEVVRKSTFPIHQAQQHQLDDFSCLWNNCPETYSTSDDLLNHIMSNHEELDCRFGGCEVSLKDPMQLKHHVVEDHLQYNFPWPDDALLDQQYSNVDGNCLNLSNGMANVVGYPTAYVQPGVPQPVQYFDTHLTYPPAYGTTTTNFNQATAAFPTLPHQQNHPTYADQAQSAWRDSEPSYRPRADPTNNPQEPTGCAIRFSTPPKRYRSICVAITARQPALLGRFLKRQQFLIRHALTHSDYRDYACSYCGKECTTKGQLVIHERMHTGEKPIKCEYCSKTTSNESQMAIHRRTHTGEKPHKCNICDFRCADSTNLIKHKKSHFPNAFHCEVCNRSFNRKHTLVRHMKVHAPK
ncbi:MAG: hypothetical protein Q9166_001931 [cf. Caloplaca sp. 2 TL-2023]